MGNGQLFQQGATLIEAKYRRGTDWATNQLNRAIWLTNTHPLTPTSLQEILQYEFGIEWSNTSHSA